MKSALFHLSAWCAFFGFGASAAISRDVRPEGLRDFAKLSGTVVVVLSPSCPCSKSHEPVLAELAKRFPSFGFVGLRADDEDGRKHFTADRLPFPVVARVGAASALGAMKTPHVFVFDSEGALKYRGGVDDSHDASRARIPYLADALTALDAGAAPAYPETRPLGCRVNWE